MASFKTFFFIFDFLEFEYYMPMFSFFVFLFILCVYVYVYVCVFHLSCLLFFEFPGSVIWCLTLFGGILSHYYFI